MAESGSHGVFQNDCIEKPDNSPRQSNMLNMRIVMLHNLCNWYATEKTSSRSLYNSLQRNKSYVISRPDDALNAVRALFQKTLDKEIDTIVQKFYEKYLVPAIKNIQANGYEVTSSDIFSVYHHILDEAKRMYPLGGNLATENDTMQVIAAGNATPERGFTPATLGQPINTKIINRHIPASLRRKKEAADSDTESDISQASAGFKKRARVDAVTVTPRRIPAGPSPSTAGGSSKTMDIPIEDIDKWNPDRIDENTIFVLGSKANNALGLSAQRGRIYIKHPGLFRYVGDHEDKMWLYENKQKTVKFGGKAFLVVLDDIVQLAESHEYRHNPEVKLNDLNGFTLPPFIISKMKGKMEPVYQGLRAKYGLNVASSIGIAESGKNISTPDLFNTGFVATSPAPTSEGGSDL